MRERRGWQQSGVVVELDDNDEPIAQVPPDVTIVDKASPWGNSASSEDLCPKCHHDTVVYESQAIWGASSELNMFGTCSRCGTRLPALKKPSNARDLPAAVPRDDFGRHRKGW
jgi:hypothetical protein